MAGMTVTGTHPAASLAQVTFLGELMVRRGIGTMGEVTEYIGGLMYLGRYGDEEGSAQKVLELIDYNLDMMAV